jgi:hypothetical protein
MLPKLNPQRARFVLSKIDEILAWEQRKEAEKDRKTLGLWNSADISAKSGPASTSG